jgi:predicted ATPase
MTSAPTPHLTSQSCRIALTGGPGGGKTTAGDLFRRELGDEVVMVPEAATLLFSGGFPRHTDSAALRAAQRTIFYVQRGLEDTQSAHFSDRILLCDRGTVDGQAYWPKTGDGDDDFFTSVGTTLALEMSRYDAVLFFETAAAGELAIDSNNPVRTESLEQARALDHRLHAIWSQHPRFIFIPHNTSFFKKITFALALLEGLVRELRWQRVEKG